MRAILTVIVATASVARAQPAEDLPPSQKLFSDGLALLDAHQPAEACAKFEESLKLTPDAAGPMLNLGLCNEQLDRLATALRWFRRVETRAAELHVTDAEQAARDKSTALASKVPTLKIAFTQPEPPKASRVVVDGQRLEDFELARYEVDAGHHAVELYAGNVKVDSKALDIADGEHKTVELVVPPPPAPPPPPVHKTHTVIDRGAHQRRLAYIVGGIGGGLLIGDTVLMVIAKHEYDSTMLPSPRQSWQNVAHYGATSIFVVGAGALAAAVWLYVRAPGPERVEQTVVAPVIDRGHVGLAFSRAF